MKFPWDFIGKTKHTSYKEGVLYPLQGYRLEFPNKVSFFFRFGVSMATRWRNCHFCISSSCGKFRHSYLKLLKGLVVQITALRCIYFKQFLWEGIRYISIWNVWLLQRNEPWTTFFAFQRQTLTLFLGSKLRPQIVFRAFCYNNYIKKNSFTRFPIMRT